MQPTAVALDRIGIAHESMEARERGQQLACQMLEELIEEIRRRAGRHQLDRGLRLSFPYFDDRRLSLRWRDFTVIPRGRILFVPAFVTLAAEREIARIRGERGYTEATRDHLISLLERLGQAFSGQAS